MPTVTESDKIAGVWIVEPAIHGDQRGLFIETYRREWFPNGREMMQGNRANRQAGRAGRTALPPAPGRLLVRAVRHGPCRAARPARGRPHRRRDAVSSTSRGDNHIGVFIPPGVAHGFAALTDMVITYLVDGYYNPADELGVMWNDPAIGADWGVDRPDPVRPRPDQPAARRPAGRPPSVLAQMRTRHEAVRHRRRRVHRFQLRASLLANTDDEVTVFDALTYAGNLASIRDVARRSPLQLRARRHLRPRTTCSTAMDGHDAVVHFAAETHVDRSIKDGYSFVRTNCFGTNVLCDVARRSASSASCTSPPTRCTARSRRARSARPIALGAAVAVLGGEGRQRPDRARATSPPTGCR